MSKKPNLYVCSATSFCGKSTVSLGLALNFKEQGYKVGYFKPIGWEMSRDTRGEKIMVRDGISLPFDYLFCLFDGSRHFEGACDRRFSTDFFEDR